MLILILFLVLSILNIMANRKNILDQNKEKLLDSVNAANQVYTNEELSTIVDELRERQDQLLGEIYPVGSIYKSTTDKNPAELFGGTWELLNSDYDYIPVGSQTIYDFQSDTSATKTQLLATYGRSLVDIFGGLTTPPKYVPAIRITAQVSNNGGSYMQINLNNQVVTNRSRTWSSTIFRNLIGGSYIDLNMIPLVPNAYNTTAGVILYTNTTDWVTNTDKWANYYNITVSGFYRSIDKMYTYKRTA